MFLSNNHAKLYSPCGEFYAYGVIFGYAKLYCPVGQLWQKYHFPKENIAPTLVGISLKKSKRKSSRLLFLLVMGLGLAHFCV